MTSWKTWLIEPHDPLIARDGRPFNNTPGARASSLPFPMPATLAGAARTLAGSDPNTGQFVATPDAARSWELRGPLLAELRDTDVRWMLPAPADALLLRDNANEQQAHLKQLVPLVCEGASSDLASDLLLVGTPGYDPAKPLAKPPTFWYWDQLVAWLSAPSSKSSISISQLGHRGPAGEARVHVGIDPASQVASEGMLFQTRGLEFTHSARPAEFRSAVRLALAIETTAPLRVAVAPIGGERRLARWEPTKQALPGTPEQVAAIAKAIAENRACRVLLLTPALFNAGFRPEAQSYLLHPPGHALTLTVRAVAAGRAQVLSGWDLERGGPKATRRFVPAGTVLFVSMQGAQDVIEDWVRSTWLRCVSDGEQERRDGFGLAVFGAWSGRAETIAGGHTHANTD